MKNWDYFDKYDREVNMYLPAYGQGVTKASQIVTAVNKLVYKWFNDGDVYDNRFGMPGWCNDLSSYANWLYANTTEVAKDILNRIKRIDSDGEYEDLLADLCEELLDAEDLENAAKIPAIGDIYHTKGSFAFEEYEDR